MSYRYMRIILFFDLPTQTAKDRKEYALFRKNLIKGGFIMMQESVYIKLVLNNTILSSVRKKVLSFLPPLGLIQTLVITEKQFSALETMIGESRKKIIDNTERFVVL